MSLNPAPSAAAFGALFFSAPGSGADVHPWDSMQVQTPGCHMLVNCVCVLSLVKTFVWLL